MPNCVDEDAFFGVALMSEITDDRIVAAAVCEIELWFVLTPIGSKLKMAIKQKEASPIAIVTSIKEKDADASRRHFTVGRP
jgi:hypothetical protein